MSPDLQKIEQELKKTGIPLDDLNIDEESKYVERKQEKLAEIFFNNIVDYSKWITSIALAALLLIGTIFRDKNGISNHLFLGSLILIFFSIIFSIILIYCVLRFWKREYEFLFDMSNYYTMLWTVKNKMNIYSIDDCEKSRRNSLEKISRSALFTMPELYVSLISAQILLFCFGMLCYVWGVNVQY
jgi:hypothetical protein